MPWSRWRYISRSFAANLSPQRTCIYLGILPSCYKPGWSKQRSELWSASAKEVDVNVNVHVYSPDIPVGSADCTIYTPGIGTLFYCLTSSGENSAFACFAAAIANHYNSAFSFHQVPITAGWTEAVWYERLAQHFLHMAGSVTRAAVTHPSTNWARRCLTSVSWRELVTIWPCATTCVPDVLSWVLCLICFELSN